MSTGKAAHPAATSMGTQGNKLPTVLVLLSGWSCCETSGSVTSLRPAWTVLLRVTSPRICVHKTQVSEWCTGIPVLARWVAIVVFCTAAIGFTFLLCCVCVCACACMRVCVCRNPLQGFKFLLFYEFHSTICCTTLKFIVLKDS